MAISIYDKYGPSRATAPTTEYPNGSIQNESIDGANDGTPLDQDWGNDYAGFDGAIFSESGHTISGDPDTSDASDRLIALRRLFGGVLFDTVDDLQSATLIDGTKVQLIEREYAPLIIQPSTYTALEGDITLNSGQVAALQVQAVNDVRWWGAVNDYDYDTDTGTDNTDAIQSAVDRLMTLTGEDENVQFASLNGGDGNYGVGSQVEVLGRGFRIYNMKFIAIGEAVDWGDDYVLRFNAGYGGMTDVFIDCKKRANGLLSDTFSGYGREIFNNLHIYRMKDYGLNITSDAAPEKRFVNCYFTEYTTRDTDQYWDNDAYTAVAVRSDRSDIKFYNCHLRWSKTLFESSGSVGVQLFYNCHLYNGIVGDDDIQKIDAQLINWEGSDTSELTMVGCYLDNGKIDLYNDRVNFIACSFIMDGYDVDIDYMIQCYARGDDEELRLVIESPSVQQWDDYNDDTTFLSLVDYDGNTWLQDLSSFRTDVDFQLGFQSQKFTFDLSCVSRASHIDRRDYLESAYYRTVNGNEMRHRDNGQIDINATSTTPVSLLRDDEGAVFRGSSDDDSNIVFINAGANTAQLTTNKDTILLGPNPGDTTNSKDVSPFEDDAISSGVAGLRWSEIFSVNGTINTSDSRLKLSEDIPDEVLDAWANVEKVIFRWVSSVETKGDDARYHIGVLAQQVQEAFEAEGLDASRYGVFCYDEWDDVEMQYDVKTDDGDSVETVTVSSGERYSVRYDQAAQLDAALERRERAKLEARIEALES